MAAAGKLARRRFNLLRRCRCLLRHRLVVPVWLCLLALLSGSVKAAAETLRYSELADFLRRARVVSMPEEDLAARLRKIKLSTSIPEGVLASWQAGDFGRLPLGELERLARESANKRAEPASETATEISGPEVSESDQRAAMENLQRFASTYARSIPNFTCVRSTRMFMDKKGFGKWRKGDAIEEQLSMVDGEDSRKLIAVNGKKATYYRRGSSTIAFGGEFGNLIRKVFLPETGAAFEWGRAVPGNGAIIRYRVPRETSSLVVESQGRTLTVGYSGEIEIERDSGKIVRFGYVQDPFPVDFPITGAEVTIHYGRVDIDGTEYNLPVRASMLAYLRPNFVQNRMEYRDYRKFDASSDIRFDAGPPPVPGPESRPPQTER